MNNYRLLGENLILLAISLLVISFGAEEAKGSTRAGGQVVDMPTYVVKAPLGEEWKSQTNDTNRMVIFNKNGPGARFTIITVLPGTLSPRTANQTEDKIATMILGWEEQNMRERGAARSYVLRDVSREVTTIGGKKLYVMSYTITDRSGGVLMEIRYAMYLYLPPDLRQKRVFYGFLIGESYRIGESIYETDLTRIHPVISSFRRK